MQTLCVISLGVTGCRNWEGQKPQWAGPHVTFYFGDPINNASMNNHSIDLCGYMFYYTQIYVYTPVTTCTYTNTIVKLLSQVATRCSTPGGAAQLFPIAHTPDSTCYCHGNTAVQVAITCYLTAVSTCIFLVTNHVFVLICTWHMCIFLENIFYPLSNVTLLIIEF